MKYYKYNQEKMQYEEVNKFKIHLPFALTLALLSVLFFSTSTTSVEKSEKALTMKIIIKAPVVVEQKPKKVSEKPKVDFTLVTGTYYHSDPLQGEGDGSTTADGSKIDINLLESGQIKWVALSRNLLKQWGGKFKFGDRIIVEHEDKRVAGIWIVRDCMNARFTNKIDFLIPKGMDFCGKIKNIKLTKA